MSWHDKAVLGGRFVKFDEGPLDILFSGDEPEEVQSSFAKEGEARPEFHFPVCSRSPGADEWTEGMTLSVSSMKLLKALGDLDVKKDNLAGMIVRIGRRGYGRNTVYDVTPIVEG